MEDDIEKILVPKFDVNQLISRINESDSLAVEFLGRKGRGKTTHLIYLQKQMPDCPIFFLDKNSSFAEIINSKANIVFIDSIHHLSVVERLRLFRDKEIVIYTTHWSRKMECLLAGKTNLSIKFRGINEEVLLEILNKRLELATIDYNKQEVITLKEVNLLIKKYGDNYRGIINHLYQNYQ